LFQRAVAYLVNSGAPIRGRLQAAAHGALHFSSSCLAFCDELAGTPDPLVDLVFITCAIRSALPYKVWIELESASKCGLVDPFSSQGVGEQVEAGLVVFGDDVGVVGLASSGHRGVDTSAIGGTVDEEEAYVDGTALGGVAGLGVSELQGLGHVLGGQGDGARPSGDFDAAVSLDAGDSPVVAVLHDQTLIGPESPVVPAGDHLITHQHHDPANSKLWSGNVQFLGPTALVMGAATTIAGRAALKARLQPSTTGTATLIGKAGTVVNVEGVNGTVFLDGAWWSVRSSVGELEPGEQARVVGIEGLKLIVEPIGANHEH
jgi:membrane protein implicated in regulation of membrane protease activity